MKKIMKKNIVLSNGISITIIGGVSFFTSFIPSMEYWAIAGIAIFFFGLFVILIGLVIQKLDEVIEALSPRAAIEINEALDRHRQWIEDAAKRETKWQSLQVDSTSYTDHDDDDIVVLTSTTH